MIEQSRETVRRIQRAQIPPRLRGLSLLDGEDRPLTGFSANPDRITPAWSSKVLNGLVVSAAGEFSTCGVGVWATGSLAAPYLTATMRDLMVQAPYTGLYLTVDDYLDSMRPDADRRYADRIQEDQLLVLANVGAESMTDWTRSTVRSLLLKRYDAGLPTLVAAMCSPSEYLAEGLAEDMFVRVAIMREVA